MPDRADLRSVAPPADRDELARGVMAVVEACDGLPRRSLGPAVAAWLAVRRPAAAPPDAADLLRAVGMLIVQGALDEREGRLVSLRAEHRRAG
ncbi:MAG: hypothetical protein MUE51_05110 [Thermoleophilia bacterium]|jgi:hypothetical protein|nr:hypothetical protein [Thermoleophilia bacterium]